MDLNDFSMRLAQLRENRGVSAREMSLDMGQNPGYINNIENGKSYPSLLGIIYICQYLNISESEFFDLKSKNPSKLNDIIKDMKCLDDKQLDIIADLIKNLINKP